MASILKRKRNSDANELKRAHTTKILDSKTHQSAGWEAAFGLANGQNELAKADTEGDLEAQEFDSFVAQREDVRMRKSSKAEEPTSADWKVSSPTAGRMADVDPVFTLDEKFLIIAHRKSIKVYSTANSLLHRSIELSIDELRPQNVRIVAYALSQTNNRMLWVACSDGTVYHVDWTTGTGSTQFWTISSMGIIHMTVAPMDAAGRLRDILFTTEETKDGGWRITAHQLTPLGGELSSVAKTIYTSNQPIHLLKAASDGAVIVAASEARVLMGCIRSKDFKTLDEIKYDFRIFQSTDFISCLDVRVTQSKAKAAKAAKSRNDIVDTVDVVVGDVKGSIFIHNDLLAKLVKLQHTNANVPAINILPRKLHWHRKSVGSVKWSLDGNYVISGGSETVLVLWQLDTGKPQFLPHLSAAVQNIVVSPTGTSYAVRLADNSAMALSTAELKPTLHISGIQSQVFSVSGSLEPRVARIKDEERKDSLAQRTPASINPAVPSTLLLAVGETQEIDPTSKQILSNPYLQTFDIGSDHTLSRQALTRTNITNVNVAPKAHRISEPRITQMQTNHDGKWLATVDEWLPPRSDVEFLGHSAVDLAKEQHARREIHLKFWQWSNTNAKWELISRIDAPHAMGSDDSGAGRVFELIANPSSTTFSTIGEDGFVRIWHPRTRTRDGVIVRGKDGEALVNWGCHAAISLGSATLNVDPIDIDVNSQRPEHGCLAFSEDGSVLAAAMTSSSNGLIHLIDPFFGTIKFSRPMTYRGNVLRMIMVSQCLAVLSDDLRVYDLVQDELQYGISLGQKQQSLSLEQKVEMMHLSVDRASKTFAVCLPCKKYTKGDKARSESLISAFSEIAIFEAHRPDPVMVQILPHLVTALVPALGSPGYVVLDTAAEITTISPNANQAVSEIETAKRMADLPVHDTGAEEPELDLMQLIQEAQEKDEEMSDISTEENDAEIDVGGGPPVVSQQALANTFEAGPFALPPIEEMFYQVANLLSHKPAAQVVQ